MTTKKDKVETPLMKQYYSLKDKHPDAVLLFRVGDFYETFGEDAIRASEILGITLTKRANGSASYVELAGFPHHSLDTYLPKLVRAGQRVAICEQLEDPKKTKKIVKRGITELVTPGVSLNDNILQHKENNYLAAIHIQKNKAGVGFLDISTGDFLIAEGTVEYADKLLSSLAPKELLYRRDLKEAQQYISQSSFHSFPLDDWVFTSETAHDRLLNHFGTQSFKGFGIEDMPLGIIAAGACFHYLSDTQHNKIQHISKIQRIQEKDYVWLDKFTIRNLELFHALNFGGATFIDVLDDTISPMGSRMLKHWVALPLKDAKAIDKRLDVVSYLVNNQDQLEILREQLSEVGDLERIISKVSTGKINPREVLQLGKALKCIEPIQVLGGDSKQQALQLITNGLDPLDALTEKINTTIQEEAPNAVAKGNVIKEGISDELDELRSILNSGKNHILGIQEKETESTGIPSLKIGFNNVFGYYIEVRNTHKDKVPENWIRKQTLVNAERYITEELKEFEQKVLGAEEKIQSLEASLFETLVQDIFEFLETVQRNAKLIAQLDCFQSFASKSIQNNYHRPVIDDSLELKITDGRHPVIEKQLPIGEKFITNNITLDSKDQQIMMITGPNMSGKSAILRQTALIVLMAQIGCFVSAKEAHIGYIDKIFTRVGASDNISQGESTFMVEMNEAASILNNLSSRSLVLLDEIGRGTSTYDGISIAWAMAEFIHDHPKANAKTLFATHYHELNDMEASFKRIKNFNVAVKESGGKVVFLRKLKQGGSEHSFGIHVAELAGMPQKVIEKANDMLTQLEGHSDKPKARKKAVVKKESSSSDMQMSFFQLDDPTLKQIRDEIKNLDINNLTPVEALNKLHEIKKITGI